MLGSISKVFPEGLVHNVNCMFRHVGPGSGWAGGVGSREALRISMSFWIDLGLILMGPQGPIII